jgi:hypothetical protein
MLQGPVTEFQNLGIIYQRFTTCYMLQKKNIYKGTIEEIPTYDNTALYIYIFL